MYAPVHATLIADSTVLGYVGTEIYRHDDAAAERSGDYLTWSVILTPENELSDIPGIDRQTVTVNVWSDDDARVELIARAVRDAMEPIAHMIGSPVDNRDRGVSKKYRIALQFDWWYPRPI